MPLPHGSFFNTWTGTKPQGGAHPTEKPLKLIEYLVSSTKECGIVLDPFMGSGTTGVAALQLGRKFIGIEVDPAFFDIACRRMEKSLQERSLLALCDPRQAALQTA